MKGYPENWSEISAAAKIRARFTCHKCGEVLDPWHTFLLHTHHIDYNKANSDASNLEVLCKECHFKLHRENDPLFYLGEETESYDRFHLPKPVRISEVINDVFPKYLAIQRINLPEVQHDKEMRSHFDDG